MAATTLVEFALLHLQGASAVAAAEAAAAADGWTMMILAHVSFATLASLSLTGTYSDSHSVT